MSATQQTQQQTSRGADDALSALCRGKDCGARLLRGAPVFLAVAFLQGRAAERTAGVLLSADVCRVLSLLMQRELDLAAGYCWSCAPSHGVPGFWRDASEQEAFESLVRQAATEDAPAVLAAVQTATLGMVLRRAAGASKGGCA